MWITKVQLSDIKSYGKESPLIEFRPGVNLIQGHNGAGKSTLLEAIGLALFDSRAYTNAQFVREGASSGRITVGFVSALDEREYEIVRGVGSSSVFYIYDPEIQQRLCEGREDSLAFIRSHLRVDAETNLSTLFEDAVGVPQGTMTAIFREAASTRKNKFNRLLHIDTYERVWEALRATDRYIDDLIGAGQRERDILLAALEELPAVRDEIARLAALVAAGEADIQAVENRLAALEEELGVLDAQKAALDALETQTREFRTELTVLDGRLEHAAWQVAEAQQAAEVVARTAAGHKAYEEAQSALEKLEDSRRERDRLVSKHHAIDTELQVARQKLSQAQGELQAIRDASQEMDRLRPLMDEQAAQEARLAEALQAEAAQGVLTAQVERYTAVARDLTGRLDAVLAQAAEVDVGPEPVAPDATAAQSSDLAEAAAGARETLSQLEQALERVIDLRAVARQMRDEWVELQNRLSERASTQQALDELDVKLKAARAREREAQLQVAQLEQAQVTLEEHAALLGASDALCPVCRRPLDEHARQESQAHYTAERERLASELAQATQALDSARQTLSDLEAESADLTRRLRDLPAEQALEAAERRVSETAAGLDERLADLRVLLGEAQAGRDQLDSLLAAARSELEGLAAAAGQAQAARAALEALGEPRRAYERAAERAARLSSVETEVHRLAAEVREHETHIQGLDEALAAFADLDTQLDDARQVRDGNEEAYRSYLANRGVADQLEARQAAVASLEEEKRTRQTELDRLEAERAERAAGYDADAHGALRQEQRNLQMQRVESQTRLAGQAESLEAQRRREANLEARQRTLEEVEARLARLETRKEAFDFIRDSIRRAGPRVTQELVRLIAAQANRTFGDILGNHSLTLNWSDDYAISVTAQGEERPFELLSGGEQMVAALAVRLALLTQLAGVQFAFFDEPTTNLDDTRRSQLAESLAEIRSLRQLFVISHDDTFAQESYHVIQVQKVDGLSQVETL